MEFEQKTQYRLTDVGPLKGEIDFVISHALIGLRESYLTAEKTLRLVFFDWFSYGDLCASIAILQTAVQHYESIRKGLTPVQDVGDKDIAWGTAAFLRVAQRELEGALEKTVERKIDQEAADWARQVMKEKGTV